MKNIKNILIFLGIVVSFSSYALEDCQTSYYQEDYKSAFECFSKAINKDPHDPTANTYLGNLYYEGLGTEQNSESAFKHLKIASESNDHVRALLASLYLTGDGVEMDYVLAYYHASESAKNNNSYGQLLLGYMYYHGLGTTKNYNAAFENIHSSATQVWCDNRAQIFLATLYEKGKGVKCNLKEAYKWYLIGKANLNTDKNPTDFTVCITSLCKSNHHVDEFALDLDTKINTLEKSLTQEDISSTQIDAQSWLDFSKKQKNSELSL